MSTTRQSTLAVSSPTTTESDKWHGDEIICSKDDRHTRIMFQNINGISLRGPEGVDMFINEQSSLQVDIHCFSEHCLDTSKFTVTQAIRDALRRHIPGPSTFVLSSSTEPAVNVYKPGGTGVMILGKVASRLEPNGKASDDMGRWSICHLRRSNLPPITVISIYQVCPRPTNAIGNTAYHQQRRALDAIGRTVHPRQAFVADLDDVITQLREKRHDIILGGDFNETIDDRHSGLLRLATAHQLVDPFMHRFPNHTPFGTHIHGNRRIDTILVSPALLPTIHKVGYAPFYYARNSDHRPIMLEFISDALFGSKETHQFVNPPRLIRSNDKRNVTTFITAWYDAIASSDGFWLQQQLENDIATHSDVEMLDEIIGKSGDFAESKCCRRRPEFYSRQLVQQRLTVSILRGHLNALKRDKDRTTSLQQRMKRAGLDIMLPETISRTRMALERARQALRDTCQTHAETRRAELTAKIDEASTLRNKPKEKILRSIRTVEDHKRTYKILQAMKQRTAESTSLDRLEIPASWPPISEHIESVTHLEDPKCCAEWKVITEPTEIEHYLILRNRLHFGQAEGTPFTRHPLCTDIDWMASTHEAELLLQGRYPKVVNIPNCNSLLDACKATAQLDALPALITMDDFKGKMTKWRESTSTSPSGRHLGRYKSLFVIGEPGSEVDTSSELSIQSKQEAIASLILTVLNYCIRHNHVLNRWKKIVNMMIFKEPGNFRIHKLRIIHIYEADFNLILAVKWRQLLQFADKTQQLNHGQYGGRPGCEAQSLTLLEELKYDLAYLTRRTLFNFDNDATSCYDRIVVPLASVINRKYGLHRDIVALHASTLRHAQFFLKTAAGISLTHYSHCETFPIHGTGQGSGNSPCIWLFISSTLFDVHSTLAHGCKFITPDGRLSTEFSMVGFVDDSTGTYNDFRPHTEENLNVLALRMQHDSQLWNDLLYSSGGKLELPKCSFHVLRFDFQPTGRPVPSIESHEKAIHILDHETNSRIPIKSKRSFETHKTLGHHKSPYGAHVTELQALCQKAHKIAMMIAISPLTRFGAEVAYRTIYLPTISYTLPQSCIPKSALDRAQSHSIGKILAKCGYNRNTARALIYAPATHAGGGFMEWYLLQGTGQVQHFIKHMRTNTIVSRTLRVAIHWAQWQSGHNLSIFEDVTTPLPHLECRWLKSLRNFLAQIRARIVLHTPIHLPMERQHDIYIMQYARESNLFNDQEMSTINYCRLYLHVTTLSELFDADGKRMIPTLFHCHREPWFNPSTYITLQQRPTAYHIRTTWQKLCRQWATEAGQCAASLDLGPWITPGNQLRRRRQSYIDHRDHQTIYHWRDNSYWLYKQDAVDDNTYHPVSATQWEPSDPCTPVCVTVHQNGNQIHLQSTLGNPIRHENEQTRRATFDSHVQTLPQWEILLLTNIEFRVQPNDIMTHISRMPETSHLYLVSDGSLHDEIITYAWVLGTDEGQILAVHSGQGFGENTSHRAEAWGMLSGLRFLHQLYCFLPPLPNQSPRSIMVYADNSGLISRVTARQQYTTVYPNATLKPDWDIVEQIHHTILEMPHATIEVRWVRGHQDDFADDLPIEAQYNVQADALAKSVSATHQHSTQWYLPAAQCTLEIVDRAIHNNYKQEIHKAYALPKYFAYLEQRHQWTPRQRRQVDWEVFTKAVASTPLHKIQLVKLVHDKLPTGHEQAKTNPFHNPTCQHCRSHDETFLHLLRCDNPISSKFRGSVIEKTTSYMESQHVSATFQDAWILQLQETLQSSPSHDSLLLDSQQTECYRGQQRIGQHLLLRGLVSRHWWKLYESSSTHPPHAGEPTRGQQNSKTIIINLVKILWQEQHLFWEEHSAAMNHPSASASGINNTKLNEYKARIRWLHTQKDRCLHGHRDRYFHSNLEEYLNTATGTQMRQYLLHYEPVIHKSIAEAQKHPLRTIFTFPGFQRTRRQSNHHATGREPPPTGPHPLSTATIGESNLHRNHTRWKNLHRAIGSIRDFFPPKPPD